MTDIRLTLRRLARQPGSSLLAILVLGLGIGLVGIQFSFVNGVMLKGLPFAHSEDLFVITRLRPGQPGWAATGRREFEFLRRHQTKFEGLGAFSHQRLALSGAGAEPRYYRGAAITSSTLGLLGAKPVLGRGFVVAEEGPEAPALVILGHEVWQRDFGGDPRVLGQVVKLNGQTATVVGVMPSGFAFPVIEEIWTNLRVRETASASEGGLEVFGRLRRGEALGGASAEMDALAARLAEVFPESAEGYTLARVQPYAEFYSGPEAAPMLWTMLAMVFGVLMIACSNVANLLLGRAVRRVGELGIRNALGASRWSTVRLVLGESLVLSVLGGVLGLWLAQVGTVVLGRQLVITRAPFWFDVSLDWRGMGVVAGCVLLAGVVAGLFPALQASRVQLNDLIKDSTRGMGSFHLSRFSKWLVTGQVAISCCLLVLTSLMAKSVARWHQHEPMPNLDAMVSARVDLIEGLFGTPASRESFFEAAEQRLRALPGGWVVAWTSRHPGDGTWVERTRVEGRATVKREELPLFSYELISPDYFRAVGVPVLSGRPFLEKDGVGGPAVCMVNRSLAEKYWPGENAIGKRLHPHREGNDWLSAAGELTVVGVVPDLGMTGRSSNPEKAGVYLPWRMADPRGMHLLARSGGDLAAAAGSVRDVLREVAPEQPVTSVQTVREAMHGQARVRRLIRTMFVVFGAAAMFLACVGVYGVTSFALQQRTREFGLRIALGAGRRSITALLLRQCSWQLGGGVAAGLLLALGLSQPLRMMLFGVSTTDPTVYLGVLLVVITVAVLSMSPAMARSARIDPAEALRAE